MPNSENKKQFLSHRTTKEKSVSKRLKEETATSQAFLKAADVISSMMDITEVLKNLSGIVKDLLGCDYCITFLWDDEKKVFKPGETSGLESEKEIIFKSLTIKPKAVPAFKMVLNRQDVVVKEITENSLFNRRIINLFNIKSVLQVPIIIKNKPLGSLMVVYKKACHKFTERDLRLAHGIAHYASFALNNVLLVSEFKDLLTHTVIALASAIDAKSRWTQGHSERVSDLIVAISTEMGMGEMDIEALRLAGLLHDIGKLGIPEGILDKHGRLTDEEYDIVKKHSLLGAEILSTIKQFRSMVTAALSHHERYDGKGYPKGLKGKEIPLVGRIMAVADAYEAMTAIRPYRTPRSHEEIINELIENKGKQFDPKIVDIFLRVLKKNKKPN